MHLRSFQILSVVVGLAVMSAPTYAAPDPESVYIVAISYEGSGCPQGSVGSSFSSERQTFTLIFDQFVASTGVNVPSAEGKKDCEFTFLLNVPSGFQGGELTLQYRGYQSFGAGAVGSVKRKYSSSKTTATTAVVGAVARDYLYSDPVAFAKTKSCDGTPCLVAKVKIATKKALPGSSQMTIDSIEGQVSLSN